MNYLREFVTKPVMVGSIVPSSRFLAEEVVRDVGLRTADSVLEYGPGTGVLTEFILRELKPDANFAAIELNPRFAREFRSRYPQVRLFEDSVTNVRAICDSAGMQSVDCIVSAVPLPIFPEPLQLKCLDEAARVLKPGGSFVMITYVHSRALPSTKRFTRLLSCYFKTISKSPIIWLNIPPAFVYRCRL